MLRVRVRPSTPMRSKACRLQQEVFILSCIQSGTVCIRQAQGQGISASRNAKNAILWPCRGPNFGAPTGVADGRFCRSPQAFSQVPQTLTGARYTIHVYDTLASLCGFAGVSGHVQDTIGLICDMVLRSGAGVMSRSDGKCGRLS